MSTDIYALILNSSTTDCSFLDQILKVLLQRYLDGNGCPGVIDIQNIPIEDEGIAAVGTFLEGNVLDTKWLNIGSCFRYEIPSQLSEKLCASMQQNTSLLRL